MNWTPEKDARLAEEWAGGDKAREIAVRLGKEFGTPLTKAAIVSRADRSGLPLRRPTYRHGSRREIQ